MADAFAVLGVKRSLDLAEDELELRYLKLSRQWHPDFHPNADDAERRRILAESARLNDAYRTLRDRWSRARLLVDLADPTAMERNKELCPAFLMTAMELGEEIEDANGSRREALLTQLHETVGEYFGKVERAIRAASWDEAATELHEARYYQRAIERIENASPELLL